MPGMARRESSTNFSADIMRACAALRCAKRQCLTVVRELMVAPVTAISWDGEPFAICGITRNPVNCRYVSENFAAICKSDDIWLFRDS